MSPFSFFIMKKRLWLGVALVFVSGMFYLRLVSSVMVIFFGGKIRDSEGILVEPSAVFYENGILFGLYGMPFLLLGLYLIKVGQSNRS